MRKRITGSVWMLVALCALLSLLAPAARAQSQTVRVGYVIFENYQEGRDGEYKSGFGYEYLQRVSYATGWEYEYVYGSFGELLQKLQQGEIDLMGNISYTPERAETILYSELPEGRERYYIYISLDHSTIVPGDLSTLSGCTIGVTQGSYQQSLLQQWLQSNAYGFRMVPYPTSADTVQALNEGLVDSIVMTDMANHQGFLPVVNLGFSEFYFGVNPHRPDLLAQLNRALFEIQTIDPYYNEKVYTKYSASSLSNKHLDAVERSWLEEHHNTLKLGYLVSNLPYSDVAEDGSPKGLIAVLIRTFQEDFGITVEAYPYTTNNEMAQDIYDGKLDLFGPMLEDYWLAEQYGLFATDPFTSTTCILLYQGEFTEEQTQSIAYHSGSAAQKGAAMVLFPEAALVECSSMEDCLQAVLDGRAGSTIFPSSALNLLVNYRAMNSLNMLELPTTTSICLATLRGNSALLNITNRVIFASSEDLSGVALMVSTRSDAPASVLDFLEQNSLVVIGFLLLVIALLVGGILFYLHTNRRMARMRLRNEELSRQAFRDGLTKVGNRASYLSQVDEMERKLHQGTLDAFALVVADVNNLKLTNDYLGHEQGDALIRNASQLICNIFVHSPVYRIGGDEFVVLLTGQDYIHRQALLEKLEQENRPCMEGLSINPNEVSIAFGTADYIPGTDHSVQSVFERADTAMYFCKSQMKCPIQH